MFRTTLALVLFLAAPLLAAADITVEPEAPKVERGGVVLLSATTKGTSVVWVAMDPGLTVVKLPPGADSKTLLLNAPANARPGTYRFLCITAIEAAPKYAEVTITVTTPEPPPTPPVPPPPPVVDELPKKLRAAYDAEPNVGKRGQLVNLIAIYSAMGDHAEKDASIKTSRELLGVLNKVKEGMLIDGVLMECRRILSAETAAALGPPNDQPLDRVAAAAHFRRLVKSLPAVAVE